MTGREGQREYRELEERYQQLVELAPESILIHDGERIVLANAAAVRLVGALTSLGVTMLMTIEVTEHEGLQFTSNRISFLTDVIVIQRYVEIEGQLRKVLAVIKMRGSRHSGDFRAYEITGNGVLLREGLWDYHGITTGVPTGRSQARQPAYPGLTEQEGRVLDILIRSGAESAKAIAEEVGLPPSDLDPVLERLTQLHYVSRKGTRYQGVARPSSP